MDISERMIEITGYAAMTSDAEAAKKFDVSYETVSRYRRALKGKNLQQTSPKILLFDIENTPTEAYVWNKSVWNTRVMPKQLIEDWFMICWAAKWLDSSEIINSCLTPEEAKNGDDKRVVKGLNRLFDEADMIIAHNGKKFDVPMANTRFLYYKMPIPSPYRIIDTLLMARKAFAVTFNHLDYLGEFLGLGRKKETNFQLWKDCMAGDKKALDEMQAYNNQDVILLEDVYHAIKGWSKSHPNMNVYQDTEMCCSVCGSENIKQKGNYTTNVNSFASYQCKDCGAYSRKTRKKLVSLAR